MTTTTDIPTTGVQARLLGFLTANDHVFARDELVEALADDLDPDAVEVAVTAAISAGLLHSIAERFVSLSWRGRTASVRVLPDGLTFEDQPSSGAGHFESIDVDDTMIGGAELSMDQSHLGLASPTKSKK